MNSDKFPNTIEGVLKQPGQFTTVENGAIYRVEISNYLVNNVMHAYFKYLEGETNDDALYFTRGYFAKEFLFEDEMGHRFFK